MKFQITLITVLIGCITFVSCERGDQMMETVLLDEGTMEPTDMVDMIEMSDAPATGSSVVINELMADNDAIITDPQGDYDDWLELHNLTDSPVVLTGMYLSDKEDNPTKWEFPENTEILANGYLIVWLDEDHDNEDATEGLHANFKLSKGGETVMLVGPDAEGNQVLDSITFEEQETDVAFGRLPDGTGEFQVIQATPGAENSAQ